MISDELRVELVVAIKETVEKYDQPEYTTAPGSSSRPLDQIIVQPYRMLFSRTEGEKGLCRTLSISWIPDRPFVDADLSEWQAVVEVAIGRPAKCGFMFADQKRIYCLW